MQKVFSFKFRRREYAFIIGSLLLLILAKISFSECNENINRIGHCLNYWMEMNGVDVQEDYAYIAAGLSGLQVFALSDPDAIQLAGYWHENRGISKDLCVDGDYAYLAGREIGLRILDIADLNNIASIGKCEEMSHSVSVFVEGSFAYVSDEEAGLCMIDISDPTLPRLTANICTSTKEAIIKDGFAYVANDSGGFALYDINAPGDPISILQFEQSIQAIGVSNEYAFVGVNDGAGEIWIIDITNPYRLNAISAIRTENAITDIAVYSRNNYYYVYSIETTGVLSVSFFANPARPIYLNSFSVDPGRYHCEYDSSNIYISGKTNDDRLIFQRINTVTRYHFNESGALSQAGGNCKRISLYQDYILADCSVEGLKIIDIYDLGLPWIIATYQPIDTISWMDIIDHKAYLACNRNIEVVDLTIPNNPVQERVIEFEGQPINSFTIDDTLMYLVKNLDASAWVYTYNISVLNNPEYLRAVYYQNRVNDHFLFDSIIIGSLGELGIFVLDVSNPNNPTTRGIYQTRNYAGRFSFQNNLIYLLEMELGLSIYYLNENGIRLLGTCDLPGKLNDVDVENGCAYIAGDNGIYLINVIDPWNPHEIGSNKTSGNSQCIATFDMFAVTANKVNIEIHECSQALCKRTVIRKSKKFDLISAYPNPFNSSTTIEFNAARPGFVSFQLYDSAGRALNSFSREQWVGEGGNRFRLDGGSLAAGEYFVLMRLNGKSQIRKITFEK